MTQNLPIPCNSCGNRVSDMTCLAFPKLIPEEIRVWGDAHNKPTPNQENEIVWEFAPGTEPEFEEWKAFQEA